MQSKISVLLLGLIAERPINPYEINKVLKYVNIDNWFSVAPSSIYATIRTLKKNGYISGTDIKEGNMPEKTIYHITPKGEHVLFETIKNYFLDLNFDHVKFNLAMIFICHLTKEEALSLLNERLEKINIKLEEIQKRLGTLKKSGVASYGIQTILYMYYLTSANQKTTLNLLEIVQNDFEWNHFITNYI